jgi:AraC-like DNA-binding protein
MRQIVRKKRPIVQATTFHARRAALACGSTDAAAWRGNPEWFEWSLDRAIGYLLPTDAAIEATCAAGVTNRIRPGEMLVINRGDANTFRLKLGGCAVENTKVLAVMGHIRLKTTADTFAHTPSRAMTMVKLDAREFSRVETLAKLIAAEAAAQPAAPRTLLAHLEKALYESLTDVLCACDPLGLPQFAAMADNRLATALRAMTADPARQWRVDTLAREAALSRTLFATRFKLLLGTTPLEYLTALRVQLAATIREESPERTLHDIAQSVGYADESALRRAQRRVA